MFFGFFLLRAVVFSEPPKLVLLAFTGIPSSNGLIDPVIKGILYLFTLASCPLYPFSLFSLQHHYQMVRDFSPFQKLYVFPISSSMSQPCVISLRLFILPPTLPPGDQFKDLSNFNKELEKQILEGSAISRRAQYYPAAGTTHNFSFVSFSTFYILNSQNIHESSWIPACAYVHLIGGT